MGLNSRFEKAKHRIVNWKIRLIEMTATDMRRKIREWEKMSTRYNTHIQHIYKDHRGPNRRGERNQGKIIFKKIIAEKFPQLTKGVNAHIQGDQKTPKKMQASKPQQIHGQCSEKQNTKDHLKRSQI